MSTITTGRTHARRVENARYANRAYGGQFAPSVSLTSEKPDAQSWKARGQAARASRPAEFTGETWDTFIDLLWPIDRFIPFKESALKFEKAIELWHNGVRDLPTLAAQVNATYEA